MAARTQSAINLAVLALLYLTPLWIICNLFREVSGFVFLGGIGVAGLAALAFRSGWRKPLYVLLLVNMLASVTVLAVEGIVRLNSDRFTGMAGNYLYGRFHAFPGGIYERDGHMGKRIRPGFS